MFTKLYRNYIKHKLFNELFLIYSAIFIIAILILAGVVSENISLSLQKKEWDTNEQVVNQVYDNLEKNLNVTNHISRQLALNPSFRAGLTNLINNGYHPRAEYLPFNPDSPNIENPTNNYPEGTGFPGNAKNSPGLKETTGIKNSPTPEKPKNVKYPKGTLSPAGEIYPRGTVSLADMEDSQEPSQTNAPASADDYEQYFHTLLVNHREIISIGVYSPISNQIYRYTRGPKPNRPNLMVDRGIPAGASGQKLIPAHPAAYLAGQSPPYVYTIVYDINAGFYPNSRSIGKLTIDYDAATTNQSYIKYRDDFHGAVYILTTTGGVIYDSSTKYYGNNYPYFKKLKNTRFGRKLDVRSIISVNVYEDAGVVVAAATPKVFVKRITAGTRWTIYLLALVCIFTVLLLTYFTIVTFSRRIGLVMDGLKRVKEGDLAARIRVTGKRDEISEIASSFNTMCDEVNHYIQKVYVSEINQKTAELKALQAQISPHFLYNTLEAIRMRAVSKGVHEVGDMIYLLSELFRNSVKGEMIVGLDEELKHSRMYLELFSLRYQDKLTVIYNIDGDLSRYGIIKHTLQPIIENYVKYGIDIERDDNRLDIKISRDHQDILISIADNGQGIDPGKLAAIQASLTDRAGSTNGSVGLGLTNVHERIKIICGLEYGIDIQDNYGQGTIVTVKIPAKTKEELREHVQSITR